MYCTFMYSSLNIGLIDYIGVESVAYDLLYLVCWNFILMYINNYDEAQVLRFVILKLTVDLYDKLLR